MKKQKNYYKKLWTILFFFFFIAWLSIITYANWSIEKEIKDIADQTWANGSKVEFTPNWTSWTSYATIYVNFWDNSSIIWNYFKWYYYDSVYWFFKLNWSNDESKNVRIVNSTTKCSDWYWYKLWWYAWSENFWFINFSYNKDYFVYYCLKDKKLHWYAYMKDVWFQNFEWIDFEIKPTPSSQAIQVDDDNFINDTTEITNPKYEIEDQVINWNIQYMNDKKGSIFYIIK